MSRILYIQYVLSQKTADLRRNSALDFVRARNQLDRTQYNTIMGYQPKDTFEYSDEAKQGSEYNR